MSSRIAAVAPDQHRGAVSAGTPACSHVRGRSSWRTGLETSDRHSKPNGAHSPPMLTSSGTCQKETLYQFWSNVQGCSGCKRLRRESVRAVKAAGLADTDVIVTTSSGIHATPLAEFVFAALLYHIKIFSQLLAWQREKTWERYAAGEMRGQSMTLVGPGRIGREIARLARAFGMTVTAVGATPPATTIRTAGLRSLSSISP